MLERVDFFIREIGAIPVADTARIWSRCLNEINYLKNPGARGLRSRTPQPHRRTSFDGADVPATLERGVT
jgi:hypothetical protein